MLIKYNLTIILIYCDCVKEKMEFFDCFCNFYFHYQILVMLDVCSKIKNLFYLLMKVSIET